MPNIREYTNKVDLTPDERGTQALNRTAGALGEQAGAQQRQAGAQDTAAQSAIQAGQVEAQATRSLGESIGGTIQNAGQLYVRYQTTQETSRNGAAWAIIQNQNNQAWNQITKTSDPNDPSVRQKFLEETLEPQLQKFKDSFSTQEGQNIAEGWIESYREHMYQKTAADAASAAGQAAVQNQETVKNSATNTILQDPSSYQQQVAFMKDYVAHTIVEHPGMDPEQAAALGGQHLTSALHDLAMAQGFGLANKNPEQAYADFGAGKGYDKNALDEGDVRTLMSYAESRVNMARTQANADRAAADKADKQAFGKAITQITVEGTNPDFSITARPDTMAKLAAAATMPGSDPGEVRATLDMFKAATRDQIEGTFVHTAPAVYADFQSRMTLPTTDPRALSNTELAQAVAAHQLSQRDYGVFKESRDRIAADPATHLAYENLNKITAVLKSSITKSNPIAGVGDPVGDQAYAQFLSNVNTRLQAGINAGEKPEDVIAKLTNPKDPGYIGNEASHFSFSKAQSEAYLHEWAKKGTQALPPIPDPYLSSASSGKSAGAPRPTAPSKAAADFAAAWKAQHPTGK